MTMASEIGLMELQGKEHQRLLGASRSQEEARVFRGSVAPPTPWFQPSSLQN